jgi:hypothetical protein
LCHYILMEEISDWNYLLSMLTEPETFLWYQPSRLPSVVAWHSVSAPRSYWKHKAEIVLWTSAHETGWVTLRIRSTSPKFFCHYLTTSPQFIYTSRLFKPPKEMPE